MIYNDVVLLYFLPQMIFFTLKVFKYKLFLALLVQETLCVTYCNVFEPNLALLIRLQAESSKEGPELSNKIL